MKTNLLLRKSSLFLFILCVVFAFSSCEELPFDESENTEQTDDGNTSDEGSETPDQGKEENGTQDGSGGGDSSDGGPQDNPGSAADA